MNRTIIGAPCRRLPRPAVRYSDRKELRRGDWICLYCNNHNFSFRQACNRCDIDVSLASDQHEPIMVAVCIRAPIVYPPQLMRSQSDSAVHSLFPKAVLLGSCQPEAPLSETSCSDSQDLEPVCTQASWVAELLLDE